MPQQASDQALFRAKKLPKDRYTSTQEFADDLAASLIGTTQAGAPGAPGVGSTGPKGEKGEPGKGITKSVENLTTATGDTYIDAGSDLAGRAPVLVVTSTAAPPTVWIAGVSGRRIYFNAAIPGDGYSVQITTYSET